MKKESLLSTPFSLLQTFAMGILGFAGMLLLTASWGWGIATFVFFAAIEGEVIHQNIVKGMLDFIKGPITSIKRAIAARELKKTLELELFFTLSPDQLKELVKKQDYNTILSTFKEDVNPHVKSFLKQYFTKKQFLKVAKKTEKPGENSDDIDAVETELHEMEDFFIHCTTETRDQEHQSSFEIAMRNQFQSLSVQLKNEIRNKKIALGLCALFAIGAGAGQILVTMSATQIAFLALGFGSAATSFTVIGPIAIVAAVGYGIMMYHTIKDMIENETLQKWARKTKEFFHRRTNDKGELESNTRFYLRCTLAFLVVGTVVALAVFATVSTAGTWWVAGKKGAKLLGWMSKKVAAAATAISLFFMTPTLATFNVTNSLTTTESLSNKLKRSYNQYMHKHSHHDKAHTHHEHHEHKTLRQQLHHHNPFRYIYQSLSFIGRSALFVGHILSVGFTADQTPGINPIASVAVNAASEGLQDYHYITPHDHDHAHHHGHDHHDHSRDTHHEQKHEECHHQVETQEDDDEEECSHHHTDLSGIILKVVAFPIKVLEKIWDWAFKDRSLKANEAREPLVVVKCPTPAPVAPASSKDWLTQVVIERCLSRASTLENEKNPLLKNADAKAKSSEFKGLVTQMVKGEKIADQPTYVTTKENAILSKNRNRIFNSNSPSKSQQLMNDLAGKRFAPIRTRLRRVGIAT